MCLTRVVFGGWRIHLKILLLIQYDMAAHHRLWRFEVVFADLSPAHFCPSAAFLPTTSKYESCNLFINPNLSASTWQWKPHSHWTQVNLSCYMRTKVECRLTPQWSPGSQITSQPVWSATEKHQHITGNFFTLYTAPPLPSSHPPWFAGQTAEDILKHTHSAQL